MADVKPEISGIAPLFIVRNVPAALSFYRDRLGFENTFQGPAQRRRSGAEQEIIGLLL